MIDELSGLPYYYQTKTGETVWERPQAFVIPLGVLQVSSANMSICFIVLILSSEHRSRSSSLPHQPQFQALLPASGHFRICFWANLWFESQHAQWEADLPPISLPYF